MQYENLHELIRHSTSSRRYFFAQCVPMQMRLSEYGEYIHTADDLHAYAYAIERYDRAVEISNKLW